MERLSAGEWALDPSTGRVTWSAAAADLHGAASIPFGGTLQAFAQLIQPAFRAAVRDALRHGLLTGEPIAIEYETSPPAGRSRRLLLSAQMIPGGEGNPRSVSGLVIDLGRPAETPPAPVTDASFQAMVQRSPDALLLVDGATTIRFANPAAARLLDGGSGGLAGVSLRDLVHPDDVSLASRAVDRTTREPVVARFRGPSGVFRALELASTPAAGNDGAPVAIVAARDVTNRHAAAEKLTWQAYHDQLTGLPNRARFSEWLDEALSGARSATVTVLFIDLDRFKVVNDSLGHEAGDALLVAVAHQLLSTLEPHIKLARFGGDEFAALLVGPRSGEAMEIAEQIVTGLAMPLTVTGREVCTGASIGVASGPAGRTRAGELLRQADVALYQAKRAGRATVAFYEPSMVVEPAVWFELEADLRRALDRGELRLHYQPLVESGTERFVAVEGLLRWEHPTRGSVPPMDFIPLAEETGVIVLIGEWLLREGCRQMVQWHAEQRGHAPEMLHINVSARQLQHPRFVRSVEEILAETGLPPERLRLEVLERVLVEDVRSRAGTLAALRKLGIRLAIDDFGAGASSLAHLREIEADILKLDRLLVRRLDVDLGDRAVVRAVTALAHAFQMRVVAEGIETPGQAQGAISVGCDWLQGFLFGPARPASQMEVFFGQAATPKAPDTGAAQRELSGDWSSSTQEFAAILGLAQTSQLKPEGLQRG